MCLYVGNFYDCNHVRFEVHLFCRALLCELTRINDPVERTCFDLPFNPDIPGCEPHAATAANSVELAWDGCGAANRSNVVQWVICVDVCEDCSDRL
ncbi:hypothetical protein N7474_009887 [Penicillium riverlandense]|uniref:uncharacterized protein n=1 Tax=Penicillium riverlandense TaxID=1903569 RepID=UPI0025482C0B|nr:uncharacterized protein N7474_009887 [Penicillium riverlandense]KAJ5808618.1 hypothetical protein N7474_009887 [Penicillium riverlandense]